MSITMQPKCHNFLDSNRPEISKHTCRKRQASNMRRVPHVVSLYSKHKLSKGAFNDYYKSYNYVASLAMFTLYSCIFVVFEC